MKIIPPLKALFSLCLLLCLLAAAPGDPAKPPISQKELIQRFSVNSLIIPELPFPESQNTFQRFMIRLSALEDFYKAHYGEPMPVYIELAAARQLAEAKDGNEQSYLRAKNMPLAEALRLCTNMADLHYTLERGRIIISPDTKKAEP